MKMQSIEPCYSNFPMTVLFVIVHTHTHALWMNYDLSNLNAYSWKHLSDLAWSFYTPFSLYLFKNIYSSLFVFHDKVHLCVLIKYVWDISNCYRCAQFILGIPVAFVIHSYVKYRSPFIISMCSQSQYTYKLRYPYCELLRADVSNRNVFWSVWCTCAQ